MPKENKRRGKREEKRRNRDEDIQEHGDDAKRQRTWQEGDIENTLGPTRYLQEYPDDINAGPGQVFFYGLLDEEEQSYFRRADTVLELNRFADPDERALFIANVYREVIGKELKIASSQSCSRFLERLICMSTTSQLKCLFQSFNGHFLNLIQHRFASHCCETLFRQSAPVVTQETVSLLEVSHKDKDADATYVSMENLFLYTVKELKGNLGYLMTDTYASYALRLLLIVLSGRPSERVSARSTMPTKRKGGIELRSQAKEESERWSGLHRVPESFGNALENMISETTAGLDSHYFRILATHAVANPVLQLLFELELSDTKHSKARDNTSLFRKLLPDHTLRPGTTSASFLRGLIFDPIGSRLVETIIQFVPARDLEAIFHIIFQGKFRSLITNDAASFVVIKVLQRLSSKDLKEATLELCPAISMPLDHARTMVAKTLIERCVIRDIDTTPIAAALRVGDGNSKSDTFLHVLNWRTIGIGAMALEGKQGLGMQNAGGLHGSLLAQSMLGVPGALRDIVVDGILSIETPVLLQMAQDRTATHVVQKAITCTAQTKTFHRRIIHKLLDHTINLALDSVGSYVLHAFWTISGDLLFLKERIANELLKNEACLRESPSGRRVWRKWMMDLCKRRKTDWITKAREVDIDGNTVQLTTSSDNQDQMKTRIDLAREQYNMTRTGTAITG